ncbi:MAG TPA: hypothetical protein VJ302_21070 [Blastocatellia bacterium]|nr:hypothetical protein [Blastocatellia bacterium]
MAGDWNCTEARSGLMDVQATKLRTLNQQLQGQVNDLSLELSAILTIVTEACEELGIDYGIAETPLDLVAIAVEGLKLRRGSSIR